MSTRGCIAKPDDLGWTGRYNHSSSYPTWWGRELWHQFHNEYGGNVAEMIRVEVDEYRRDGESLPEYWACRCKVPGMTEGDGHDADCSPLHIEWAYVLTPLGMEVWHAIEQTGQTFTHRYAHGDYTRAAYRHERYGLLPWDGPEPDWQRIEDEVWERCEAAATSDVA